jgi:uncharacterized protein YfiM (DUF2279 family)
VSHSLRRHGAAALMAVASVVAVPLHAQWVEPCTQGSRPATRAAVGGVFVGGNAALYEYFRRAWWSGERSEFTVRSDWDLAFRDQDKLGHFLGGYQLARVGQDLLETACVGGRKAAWWGAAYAAAFQLQIEVWDGYQEKYGFSPPDLIFNTAGAALVVAQQEAPAMRAFKPTISYARTDAVKHAADFPAGSVGRELRTTVDYAGQTYWISTDVERLLPDGAKRYWPGLVRFSVGHSVTDWIEPETGATIRGRRKIVLSLDIDPEKLPGNHPLWRQVKHQLSYYRFPAPALVIAPTARGVAWYR